MRCLPVSQETAPSAGQRPQCLLLVRWCDGNESYELREPETQETKDGGGYPLVSS